MYLRPQVSPFAARNTVAAGLVLAVAAGLCGGTAAAEPEASLLERRAGGWKLESLHLRSGQELHGLWQQERENEVEFLEVARPAGKPMYLILRPVPTREIVSSVRLAAGERAELAARVQEFRHRAVIEAGRMEGLELAGSQQNWKYQGTWFALTSTADENSTRRVIVRLEQVFRAYRNVLPPRERETSRLKVELYGAVDEYQRSLFRRGASLKHLAYFSAAENTIVAGTDFAVYAEQAARARAENDRARTRLETLRREIPVRLARLAAELTTNGLSGDEVRSEVSAHRRAWEEECSRGLAQVAEAERRNHAVFDQNSAQMFTRLYHEAFHAYLENYVFPSARHNVPRWLNEGLAQIFESAQLDLDTLRIDAPAPQPLAVLRRERQQGKALPLIDVLAAENDRFLAGHTGSQAPDRLYAHSWGVAYFAAFELGLLSSPRLPEYVAPSPAAESPAARFEKFAGHKLPELERRWQTFLASLGPE